MDRTIALIIVACMVAVLLLHDIRTGAWTWADAPQPAHGVVQAPAVTVP